MGHVYPQEWGSGKDETESGGSKRLKGHSFYRKEEKLRDIDVRRGDRDEERQLGEKERASGSEIRKG